MSINLNSLGISNDSLGKLSMYKPTSSSGRLLLYDGDGACYTHTAGVKRIETAYKRFETDILTMMYLAKCDSAIVHLTPSGCYKNGRHLLLGQKRYQMNREGVKKPDLLNALRNTAADYFNDHPDFTIINNYDVEADDGLMIDSFKYPDAIMISADKDLLINPNMHYDMASGKFIKLNNGDRFGWIDRKDLYHPHTGAKTTSKCIGKGTRFFLAQMIMGDTADNVKGLLTLNGKSCGMAAALALLKDVETESQAVNIVLDSYRAIDQNPIPEAYAMWLLRDREDSAYKYFMEHDLSKDNMLFIEECYHTRKWRLTDDEYAEQLH